MTGAEHYLAAERAIDSAKDCAPGSDKERFFLSVAQVRATLALAAATALAVPNRAGREDFEAWHAAAGSAASEEAGQ
jgi:hypothetical protein